MILIPLLPLNSVAFTHTALLGYPHFSQALYKSFEQLICANLGTGNAFFSKNS